MADDIFFAYEAWNDIYNTYINIQVSKNEIALAINPQRAYNNLPYLEFFPYVVQVT